MGTGLSLSSNTVSLAASGVTAGTYGSTTAIPAITVDTYGRVTSVSTKTVYPPTSAGTSGYVWTSDGSGQGVWDDPDSILQSIIDAECTDDPSSWTHDYYYYSSSSTGVSSYLCGYLGADLQFECRYSPPLGSSTSSSGTTTTFTWTRAFGAAPFVVGVAMEASYTSYVHASVTESTTTYCKVQRYYCNSVMLIAIGLRTDSSLL